MGRTIPLRVKVCGEVSEWLKEHAWKVCKRVKPLRGFDKFVWNEFGQPKAGPSEARVRPRMGRTIPLGVKVCGEVSEWLKEHAWKVCKRLNTASRVRIPLSPPVLR